MCAYQQLFMNRHTRLVTLVDFILGDPDKAVSVSWYLSHLVSV